MANSIHTHKLVASYRNSMDWWRSGGFCFGLAHLTLASSRRLRSFAATLALFGMVVKQRIVALRTLLVVQVIDLGIDTYPNLVGSTAPIASTNMKEEQVENNYFNGDIALSFNFTNFD